MKAEERTVSGASCTPGFTLAGPPKCFCLFKAHDLLGWFTWNSSCRHTQRQANKKKKKAGKIKVPKGSVSLPRSLEGKWQNRDSRLQRLAPLSIIRTCPPPPLTTATPEWPQVSGSSLVQFRFPRPNSCHGGAETPSQQLGELELEAQQFNH